MTALRRLFADRQGTMAIETALVAPILMMLGIGSFQVSELVSRQHELQSAVAEAEQIAVASKPDSQAKLTTIKAIISGTTGVPTADITVEFKYRCGISATLVDNPTDCGADPPWTFVHIVLDETYSPAWTQIGIGHDIDMQVERTVQIS